MYYVKYYIPPPFFFPNQTIPQPLNPIQPLNSLRTADHVSLTNPFLSHTIQPIFPISPQPLLLHSLSPRSHNIPPQTP
jgi:hypothetical protein